MRPAIINAAGAALRAWYEEYRFTPWRDHDGISPSEAATLTGASLVTIRNAVRDGRLPIWTDPKEENPRRQSRVRKSDVLRHWRPATPAETPPA